MQISRNLFVLLILCALLFCAGCTQPASQVTVEPGTGSSAVIDPAPLGLAPSDLPQGFTLAESRTKKPSEMSQLALDLGWQGGYVARYTSPPQNGAGGYEIIHSIALYPAQKMPDVIAYSEQQGQSDTGFAYTRIAVPGLGAQARGFSGMTGTLNAGGNRESNPMTADLDTPIAPATVKMNFSEIIFSRGNAFEVVKLSGPSPDTALLLRLGEKAYAKIP